MGQKQDLQKIISDLEAKKYREGEGKALMSAVQEEQTKALTPVFQRLGEEMVAGMAANWEKAIKAIKIEIPELKQQAVDVRLPEMKMPDFPSWPSFPEIKLPEIRIPEIKIPDFKVTMPDSMGVYGEVSLKGISKKNPLPVMWMGVDGKPMSINIPMMGGTSGGRGDFFTILGIQNTVGFVNINPDGLPTYSTSASGSGGSTQLVDSSNQPYSAANPFPTTATISLPAGQGDSATATRTVQAGDSSSSVAATQVGTWNINAVTSITNSVAAALVDSSGVAYSGSNPLPTTATLSTPQGPGDAATAMRVVIAGNSDASVSAVQSGTWNINAITSITNSIASALVDSSGVAYSGSNPLPASAAQSGTWNIGTVASITASVAMVQLDRDGNPMGSGPIGNGDQATALRIVQAGDASSSVAATQVGTWNIATLTSITNSVAATLVDSSGVAYSGSNPLPTTATATLSAAIGQGDSASALRTIQAGDSSSSVAATQVGTWNVATVTTITNSVSAAFTDSSGVQYSGSNPLPITVVSGALTSTLAVGDSAARTADNAGNPVKIGGIARTTNPAAYADGDRSNIGTDKIGRILNRPIQVRDLIATAYVVLSTGTETTILTAGAGTYLDLITLKCSNSSSAAQSIDIRNTSAGNIIDTIVIPAQSTIGYAMPVPYPQDATGNSWTADNADVTNSTIYIMGLFSKEI